MVNRTSEAAGEESSEVVLYQRNEDWMKALGFDVLTPRFIGAEQFDSSPSAPLRDLQKQHGARAVMIFSSAAADS